MNKAVIMAGGFGTRLRPLTMNLPKPMVPLLNQPMMGHIVDLLKKYNINDIVSVLYYQPEKISGYFGTGEDIGINMQYVQAVADYGTAGSVRNAHEEVNLDERFIIISGDVLTDFDLQKAIEFHEKNESKATILLTRHETPLQFGIVMTDDKGRITRFLEKPSWGQVFSDTINTGIYILEPEVLDLIPYQQEFDFSKDLFPLMLKNNMPLYGYIADGYWRDVGNLDEYQLGQHDALNQSLNLNINYDRIHPSAKIDPTAQIGDNVFIGENSVIAENAMIENTVIGSDVKVEKSARIIGSTIWNGVTIGSYSQLTSDVVCDNTIIGTKATIQENVFIADNCHIGDDATLSPNIKLWPNKSVQAGSVLTRSMVQEEKWQRELFTEARISGKSNIDLHPEFGSKLGTCLGMVWGNNARVIASRDPNNNSRIMKRSITSGLMSTGVTINDLQSTSIPQTRQELRTGRYDGGLHVRRSPRHPEKSDIIIFSSDGRDITVSVAKKIERFFYGEEIKRVEADETGHILFPERTNEIYVQRYLESLNADLIRNSNYKILIDYSYGYASTILPGILGKLNVSALSLHDYVDGSKFLPDPTTVVDDDAGKIMSSLNYQLGFSMESGSEKLGAIDERGTWHNSNRLLSLITKLFLETNKEKEPYKIAVSIVATAEIDEIASDYDVEVIRIKNSHSAMMEATRDENVKFVGGVYGNFIFPDFLFAADGMFTVGKILEMLAQTSLTLSDLDKSLARRYQYETEVECGWNNKGMIMRNLMENSEGMQRQLIEGVKIFDGNDSVLITPARENPTFIIFGESDSKEKAKEIANRYLNLLNKWLEK